MLTKSMIRTIDEGMLSSPIITKIVCPPLSHLPIGLKRKNVLLNKIEASRSKTMLQSYPYRGIFNLTNACNMRCNFCEIHYFHQKFDTTYNNSICLETIKKLDPWLRYLYNLEFYGSVGEPLLNPDFIEIVKYLKTACGTRLFVNTNGILMNEEISGAMIDQGFDDVLISLHAGRTETYDKLVGGDFSRVVGNTRYLVNRKKNLGKKKPLIGIAFALNKINAVDIKDFVELVSEIGVDYITVNHYYGVRNKFAEDISFYSSPRIGNSMLEWLYRLAGEKGLHVSPQRPPYIKPSYLDEEKIIRKCYAPWSSIKFEGCLDYKDSHYVAICNRIDLFRIYHNEFNFNNFNMLWNHPVLQYMRGTVNTKDMNPICAFCRDPNIKSIRCTDNQKYREMRDTAMAEFLERAVKNGTEPVKGLYLLENNPYG